MNLWISFLRSLLFATSFYIWKWCSMHVIIHDSMRLLFRFPCSPFCREFQVWRRTDQHTSSCWSAGMENTPGAGRRKGERGGEGEGEGEKEGEKEGERERERGRERREYSCSEPLQVKKRHLLKLQFDGMGKLRWNYLRCLASQFHALCHCLHSKPHHHWICVSVDDLHGK